MEAQFKKGVLEMCVLFVVREKDIYGYELMKTMKARFPDVYEGTIYTVLRRLASDNYLESYTGGVSGGPQRKYYRVTEAGNARLEEVINDWRTLCGIVRDMGI